MKRPYIRAQSFLEYVLIISVVTAAVSAMALYVRRAVNANLRVIEYQSQAHAVKAVEE